MTIEAKIIADSISPEQIRLTTMQLRYPRFIHAELMTHRVFSRNASSSRAIPVERMIADLRRDPAMPIYWGSNKPGMQAGAELTDIEIGACQSNWLNSMENSIHSAEQLIELGLHKQIANRILEPWAHINVVVTATDWTNFFELRCHPDAQPEMRVLAETIRDEYFRHMPQFLNIDEWHLPYVTYNVERQYAEARGWDPIQTAIKVSVARCARVSYLTHDGRATTFEEDIKLYERLMGSVPLHASPAEHQARPDTKYHAHRGDKWSFPLDHGNFTGWRQYRKILERSV